jgi:hypothetical protein
VEDSNECTVQECNEGWWTVRNYENEPLYSYKRGYIPPNEISFGPTKEMGKIGTEVKCFDPPGEASHITTVIEGIELTCPASCFVNTSCGCEIVGCTDGNFFLEDSESNGIDEVSVTVSPFIYNFTRSEEGKVSANLWCIVNQDYTHPFIRTLDIDIVPPVPIPTEGEITLSSVDCDENKCEINIENNTITDDVVIYVWLFDQPDGKIYYSGKEDINPEFTGEVEISLDEVEKCPSNKELFVLVEAYRDSDLDERLGRLKEETFECG